MPKIFEKIADMASNALGFIEKYERIIGSVISIILCIIGIMIVINLNKVSSIGFSDYTDRVLNPSLNLIDDQHKALILANNEHAKYCQASFTAIKNNTDDILNAIKPLQPVDPVVVDPIVQPVVESVAEVVDPVVSEQEQATENEVVQDEEKDNLNSAEFALLPATDDKTNVEKMRSDLRVILRKHGIVNIDDIDGLQPDRYSLWIKDYGKFVQKCEDGKYKKSWFLRIF